MIIVNLVQANLLRSFPTVCVPMIVNQGGVNIIYKITCAYHANQDV